MFETSFTYASATPLPAGLSLDVALDLLHDFEFLIKLNPDCHSCKKLPTPKPAKNAPPFPPDMLFYEVEDDLPFMPKRLWSGGVRYNAEFVPAEDGCDITIHAPGGFTSTNHWRLLREVAPLVPTATKPENIHHNEHLETLPEDELAAALARVTVKDLVHAETESGGAGWYVEIISDAKCPRTFVSIIKGFLKNSHSQLQHAFIDHLKSTASVGITPTVTSTIPVQAPAAPPAVDAAGRPAMGPRRPTLSRRRSSVL